MSLEVMLERMNAVSIETCIWLLLQILLALAARGKREAERLRVQEDLAETERRGAELRGLLAMYPDE